MKKVVSILCVLIMGVCIIDCKKEENVGVTIEFPVQKESSCSLNSKTLLGCGDLFINHLIESHTHGRFPSAETKVVPCATGIYVVAMLTAKDITSTITLGDCIQVIRLSEDQCYEWHRVLDLQPTDHTNSNTSIEDVKVDEFENLYICGVSNNLELLDNESSLEDTERGYVASLSKNGTINWIRKFSERSGKAQLLLEPDAITYVSNSYHKKICVSILNSDTGEELSETFYDIKPYVKDFWIDKDGVFCITENRDTSSWEVSFYSFTNGIEWKKHLPFSGQSTSDFALKNDTQVPKDPLLFQANDTHLFFGGTMEWNQTKAGAGKSNAKQLFLYCLTKDGNMDWVETTPFLNEGSLIGVHCDNHAVYLAGYTDTEFLPTNEDSFQPKLAGKTDLFLEAYAIDHSFLWGTYLGGENIEPVLLGMEPDYLPAFVEFSLHKNKLFLASTTYSIRIPELNACPSYFYSEDTVNLKCRSFLSIISTKGEVSLCTFTSSESEKPKESEVLVVDSEDQISPEINDWVQSIAVQDNSLYMISLNNNFATLLTNPMQRKLTFLKDDTPSWVYYLSTYTITEK